MTYEEFLAKKKTIDSPTGLTTIPELNPMLFDFQHDIVAWALRRGRAAIFADCGMGKTPMQLEWARHIPGRVLIVAPLAVSAQTIREADKFHEEGLRYSPDGSITTRVTITNYERIEHFDPSMFTGIVLDESSILKSYTGKYRTDLIDRFGSVPFRLCCTATPAPNDFMELGNHAEFLGAMKRTEMLSMFFVHDGGETQSWRLKGHAESEFWKWVCSWAVMIRKPSDLGYDDGKFHLPPLNMEQVTIHTEEPTDGMLFAIEAQTLQERQGARKKTIVDRAMALATLILSQTGSNITVCNQNTSRNTTGRTGNADSQNLKNMGKPIDQKKLNTSRITTKKQRDQESYLPNSEKNETLIDGQNMLQTQNIETQLSAKPQHIKGLIQEQDSISELKNTALPPMNMTQFLNVKTTNAPYAEVPILDTRDSTLTTATKQEESEDCYVPVVISDLASSKTAQKYSGEQWLIWCNLNEEGNAIQRMIPGSVQVSGSDTQEFKEKAVLDFLSGKTRVLISKPVMFGYGLNLQCCKNVAFLGLSDSYEAFYQAVRRCWRFGQTSPVACKIITSDIEGAVVKNIQRKEADAIRMAEMMVENMHEINTANIRGIERTKSDYQTRDEKGESWTMLLGDCVERTREIADESIHFSVFSPPFASLYTYSASDRDMGNSKDADEFALHFGYLIKELYRVLKPGRLVSFHCMNLPTSKTHQGYIGISDFRGDLIRAFESEGFIYHSEVCIWKDPVTAMQRTKAIGLLHKQLTKDSCMSRQGVPDYLVTMRKPGVNLDPVEGELDHFCGDMDTFQSTGRLSIDIWQRYASPVWMDIDPSNTLQGRMARDEKDERHICPLQLQVIHRALQLWTNPGDLVLSPFGGIGSEGYESIKLGRKYIGIELKPSYFDQAVKNLRSVENEVTHGMLDFGDK